MRTLIPHYIYISLTFWPWTRYIGQRKAIVKICWAISKREYMAISTQMTSCVFLVEICLCVYSKIFLSSKTEKISRELIVIITTKTEHSHPIAPLYSLDFEQDCMQTKSIYLRLVLPFHNSKWSTLRFLYKLKQCTHDGNTTLCWLKKTISSSNILKWHINFG